MVFGLEGTNIWYCDLFDFGLGDTKWGMQQITVHWIYVWLVDKIQLLHIEFMYFAIDVFDRDVDWHVDWYTS